MSFFRYVVSFISWKTLQETLNFFPLPSSFFLSLSFFFFRNRAITCFPCFVFRAFNTKRNTSSIESFFNQYYKKNSWFLREISEINKFRLFYNYNSVFYVLVRCVIIRFTIFSRESRTNSTRVNYSYQCFNSKNSSRSHTCGQKIKENMARALKIADARNYRQTRNG